MKQQTSYNGFVALQCAYDLVAELSPAIAEIGRSDNALMKQLTRAVASVAMNLAEGGGRFGADRRHHFRIAYGSLREVDAGLEIARRFGWISELPAVALRDRLNGLLWALAHK
jgi:four helix bundle protein